MAGNLWEKDFAAWWASDRDRYGLEYWQDWHITYGLHSGFPLCCAMHYADTEESGPCPKCRSEGKTYELHICYRDRSPSCCTYLDMMVERTVSDIHEYAAHGAPEILLSVREPLCDKVLDALEKRGYVPKGDPQGDVYGFIRQSHDGCAGSAPATPPTRGGIRAVRALLA